MIDVSSFTKAFLEALSHTFGERVWFVGLQGSYGRGEATESSDIDLVVILDELTASDIKKYDAMVDTLPHRELICGFLCGKRELLAWEPSDLFQFYYDTKPLVGSLDVLLPLIDGDALDRAIKLGACNIYHGCVHNMLYEKSEEILKGLYKFAVFVVQAIAFVQTGNFVAGHAELCDAVTADERFIVKTYLSLKDGGSLDFDSMSNALFEWAKKVI